MREGPSKDRVLLSLEELLQTTEPNLGVWFAVCKACRLLETDDERDTVLLDVLQLLSKHGHVTRMLTTVIQNEIANTKHFEEVFRHGSWLFYILRAYILEDLNNFLNTNMKKLTRKLGKLKLKNETTETLFVDLNLSKVLETFFVDFAEFIQEIPKSAGFVFGKVASAARVRFGELSPVALTVFFLRFVCPCILKAASKSKTSRKAELTKLLAYFSKLVLELIKGKYELLLPFFSEERLKTLHNTVHKKFDEAIIADSQNKIAPPLVRAKWSYAQSVERVANLIVATNKLAFKSTLRKYCTSETLIRQFCGAGSMVALRRSRSGSQCTDLNDESVMKRIHFSANFEDDIQTKPPRQWSQQTFTKWVTDQKVDPRVANVVTSYQPLRFMVSDRKHFQQKDGITALGLLIKLEKLQRLMHELQDAHDGIDKGSRPRSNSEGHCSLVRSKSRPGLNCSRTSLASAPSSDDMSLTVLSLKTVQSWSCENVSTWLVNSGFSDYVEDFALVDGKTLLSLDASGLEKLNVFKIGHRKKLLQTIAELRAEAEGEINQEDNPLSWTTERVCQWLESLGLGEYTARFTKEDINGWKLAGMGSKKGLLDFGIEKLGHRLLLIRKIQEIYPY